jgi:predicted transcriptional regulator
MPRRETRRLTPLETLVMQAVWDVGEATVREVQERLRPVKPMAYNTVLTVMRILRDKGFLTSRRNGRADVYTPTVSRRQIARRSLKDVVNRFFGGSPAALVSALVNDENVSDEELKAIRREVDQARGGADR